MTRQEIERHEELMYLDAITSYVEVAIDLMCMHCSLRWSQKEGEKEWTVEYIWTNEEAQRIYEQCQQAIKRIHSLIFRQEVTLGSAMREVD